MTAAIMLSATVLPALAAGTGETTDKLKAAVTPGEFVLTGSEVKTIHSGKSAREYRVCVKAEKDSAPMKVMADGKEETLQPGDCKAVSGKKIVAAPAQTLTGSAHIVATYHHEKPTKLSQKK
jgi:hypothetical protein